MSSLLLSPLPYRYCVDPAVSYRILALTFTNGNSFENALKACVFVCVCETCLKNASLLININLGVGKDFLDAVDNSKVTHHSSTYVTLRPVHPSGV